MLRPTQTIILFYSRTRNGTNINFIEAFISMLNLRFLIYMNLSHYSVSTTEMFQRKQGVINQKQRMIFPRKRFKRKKKNISKKSENSHEELHFSASQNIYLVSKMLSEPYSLACSILPPPEALLLHSKKWLVAGEGK